MRPQRCRDSECGMDLSQDRGSLRHCEGLSSDLIAEAMARVQTSPSCSSNSISLSRCRDPKGPWKRDIPPHSSARMPCPSTETGIAQSARSRQHSRLQCRRRSEFRSGVGGTVQYGKKRSRLVLFRNISQRWRSLLVRVGQGQGMARSACQGSCARVSSNLDGNL